MKEFWKKRWRAALRCALLLAVVIGVLLYARSQLFPPAREKLLAASGTCRSTEYHRVALERDGELLGSFRLDERVEPNAGQLLRGIEHGDEITLLYIDDEDRTVMELCANGEMLLPYDRASAMWYKSLAETAGTALLTVLAVLLALGGIVAAVYWKNRREIAQQRTAAEEKAAVYSRLIADVHYTDEERQGIEAYLADAFGPVARIYYELDADTPHIDLAVCEPTAGRPLYTLTTLGMGAFRQRVPKELEEKNQAFAELTMLVPADWDFEQSWPLTMLKEIAHLITDEYEETAPQAGYVYGCSDSVREESGFAAVLVVPASVREGNSPRVMLSGGKIINFYLLVPIYAAEWEYIRERDSSFRLWERLAAHGIGAFVQPGRESCVDPETWFDEEIAPFFYVEHGAIGCVLVLDDFSLCAALFRKQGVVPNGLVWEGIVRTLLDTLPPDEYRNAESYSTEEFMQLEMECGDGKTLRRLALRLRDLCDDEEAFTEYLTKSLERE